MQNNEKQTKLRFFGLYDLWPLLKQYKTMIIRMVILGVLVTAADAVYPLFNRYAINHFIGQRTMNTLPVFILLYVSVIAVQAALNMINIMDCGRVEMYTNRDLRNNAFSHLQELSLSYYNQNNVGYIHARVMSDTGRIGELMGWICMDIIWSGAYVLVVLLIMLMTNARLALLVILLVPVISVIIYMFEKKLLVLNREVREQNSVITSSINEGITGVKSIRTLVIEEKMSKEYGQETDKMYHKAVRAARHSALFSASVIMMSAVALAVVLWKGGQLTYTGLMEIGTFSIFMSYALGMLDPIQNCINDIAAMIAVQVNIERYLKLVRTETEVYDSPEVIEKYGDAFSPKYENWEPLHGDISFKDVSFMYPDGNEMVLEHFNLEVPQGQNVAIVGETGAGKSTLVNLVCRFFEPTEGQILIDGRDAKERSLKWLHSNIGYVLQTPHMFSGTIRENLKYGRPDATDEEIMAALDLVCADFVMAKLKDGLDTEIGEGGDFLSTGEKQLLSIARALLADPRILILDEATSSIDTVTEKAIQEAIQTVTKGRTSFVIAHRLSTIVSADVILVVSDGKIIEKGSHQALMAAKGAYYQLYTRQYEELIVDQMKHA